MRNIREELQKAKHSKLLEKMRERSGGVTPPKRCDSCGYAPCQCLCPNCPECGGTSRVPVNPNADIHDKDYGKTKTCSRYANVMNARRISSGEEIGGLTSNEIQELTWNKIIPGVSDAEKGLAFVRPAVERGYGMGMMFGTWGQGKTLLMKIAVAEFIRMGKRARYVSLTRMMDDIRRAYDVKEAKMTALVDKIREWENLDLLAIDEIDKEAGTEWAESRFFDLVDQRWVLGVRRQALTIFSSNYGKIAELPGYLRSRIQDNRFSMMGDNGERASFMVFMNGADGRLSMPDGYKF
jgi:hypothetical protein